LKDWLDDAIRAITGSLAEFVMGLSFEMKDDDEAGL